MTEKKRAPKGRGSIIEYGDRYAGVVELPPDPLTGARRRKWIYRDRKSDVAKAMDDARAEDKRQQRVGNDEERFASYLERWIRETIRPHAKLRPSTKLSYESVVDSHIAPELGKLRVRDITPAAIEAFYTRLRAAGTGDRTVQKTHAVLHRALGKVVSDGLLEQNPAKALSDPPRYEAPEREPLSRDEVKKLLRTAKGDRLEALYILGAMTGARQGELLALQWGGIDFDSGSISINRGLQDSDAKGRVVSGGPKTPKSRRRFELPAIALTALRAHRTRMKAEGLGVGHRDLVFPATNGKPIRRQNFLRRSFYPLLEKAKLPKIHFHDLRHGAATHLAAAGAPVVQVAQLLGHSDPAITMKIYQHAFESAAGDAAKQLGDLYSERKRRPKR